MSQDYEAPSLDKDAFNCPHCNAFSAMRWNWLSNPYESLPLKQAICHRCKDFSIWRVGQLDESGARIGKLIDPKTLVAPLPNEDLPENCKFDYLEAREISSQSPRGAAALLRLCIQKLCVELGGTGRNINDDIAHLVGNGLPIRVQQALDVVRVVGNNAVHPGEMSVQDQPQTVMALFHLVNLIVENQITQPKHVSELFEELPEGARDAVQRRDRNA